MKFNIYTEQLLKEGEIYFAMLHELNDAHEYANFEFAGPVWKTISPCEANLLGLQYSSEGVLLTAEQYHNYFISYFQKKCQCLSKEQCNCRGILSLSEHRDDSYMFEQYSDQHSGICIGFDWEKFGLDFDGSDPKEKNIPRQVFYDDKPLKILGRNATCDEWLMVFTRKTKTGKNSHTGEIAKWCKEGEWRMVYKKGPFNSPNVRFAITEIIFGNSMQQAHIEKVRSYLSDLEGINFFNAGKK